jgi:ferredoxin-type protein NapF
MSEALKTRREILFGKTEPDAGRPFPPGVTAESIAACSGCGFCAEACPTKIIVLRKGRPELDFSRGECTFCGQCAERCPERVFPPVPVSKFDHAATIEDHCLALNYVDCQACRDVCPEQAIRFMPQRGGPFQPVLRQDVCTGCGACISICPTQSLSMTPRALEAAHA